MHLKTYLVIGVLSRRLIGSVSPGVCQKYNVIEEINIIKKAVTMAPLSTESNAQPTKEEFFEDKTKELNQKRETALKKNKIVVYINTLVLTFYHLAGLYGLYLTFKSVKWATIGFGKSSLIVLYSALIYYLGHSWTWQAQIYLFTWVIGISRNRRPHITLEPFHPGNITQVK